MAATMLRRKKTSKRHSTTTLLRLVASCWKFATQCSHLPSHSHQPTPCPISAIVIISRSQAADGIAQLLAHLVANSPAEALCFCFCLPARVLACIFERHAKPCEDRLVERHVQLTKRRMPSDFSSQAGVASCQFHDAHPIPRPCEHTRLEHIGPVDAAQPHA